MAINYASKYSMRLYDPIGRKIPGSDLSEQIEYSNLAGFYILNYLILGLLITLAAITGNILW